MIRSPLHTAILILLNCYSVQAQLVFRVADNLEINVVSTPGSTQTLRLGFAGGMHSGQFFLFDANGDGAEELVVFDRAGDVVKVFAPSSEGYTYEPDLSAFFPANLQNWIFLADYNCDGRKDLFTYSSFGVRVFTNTAAAGGYPSWSLTADPLFTFSSTQPGSSSINLLVNPSDIPSIADIDGDGDLDLLAFNFFAGETVEFFENQSMDNDGECGLQFARANQRWGGFSECFCDHFEFGEFTCSSPSGKVQHIEGKSLLITDFTGDGLPDALLGQETCEGIRLLVNKGSVGAPVFNSQTSFLGNFAPAQGLFFPSLFQADLTADGLPDLILSSNHREDLTGLDYTRSVFLLENSGTATSPSFEPPQPFLQHEMFDAGENAVPVAWDANGDGKIDLLVANKGTPEVGTGYDSFAASVALLTNKGNGVLEVATRNWMDLRALGLTNMSIQLVDMDDDSRPDLVVKGYGLNSFGLEIFILLSDGGDFDVSEALPLDIAINATDNPYFFDVNKDGKPDLLLGQSNGRLSLWLNSGNGLAPSFTTKTDAWLGIDRNPGRTFLVPSVVNQDGNAQPDLLLADNSGQLRIVNDFLLPNAVPQGVELYNATQNSLQTLFAGRRLWPAMIDLDGDNARELIVGTAQGGLLAFTASDSTGNPGNEVKLLVDVFPNPLDDTGLGDRVLRIETNLTASGVLYSVAGQQMTAPLPMNRLYTTLFDLGHLPTGLYFLRVTAGNQVVTKKIIVGP